MKNLLWLLITFLLIFTELFAQTSNTTKNKDISLNNQLKSIPVYTIDLDEPGSTRFSKVLTDFKEIGLKYINQGFDDLIGYKKYFLNPLLAFRNEDPLYLEEMKAVSDNWGVELNKIRLFYLVYDLLYLRKGHPEDDKNDTYPIAGCTAIIGVNNNSEVIQARNLDLGPPYMSKLQYTGIFTKKGKEVFRSTLFAGVNLFHTGMRNNAYAVSINARHRTTFKEQLDVFWNIVNGGLSSGQLLRRTLENANTYQDAFENLTNTHTISGTHYNLSGVNPGEGVLIGKGINKVDNLEYITNDKKFIVQTNYDSWIDTPFQQHDPRKIAAIKYLNDKEITEETLFGAISDKNVQVDSTILQCIMNPGRSEFNCTSPYDK